MHTDNILHYAEQIARRASQEVVSFDDLDLIGRMAHAIREHRQRELDERAYSACEDVSEYPSADAEDRRVYA